MMRFFRRRFGLRLAPIAAVALLMSGALLQAQTTAPAGASPGGGAGDVAAAPAEAPSLNAWELYRKGGVFMYPLTACSVLALALILERFIALRRSAVVPRDFLPELRRVARDLHGDRDAALAYCQAADVPIARMLAAGIRRLPRGLSAAEKAIEDAGANEMLKLRRNMRFLYALGSVATLLGLIGTISGMIIAFQNAAASGTGDVHKLSTGIYEAMVNTFGGLAVAIVVTTFYYYFVSRIERLVAELNDTLSEFGGAYGFNAAEEPQTLAEAGALKGRGQ